MITLFSPLALPVFVVETLPMGKKITCIRLYQEQGMWCFDHPEMGISQEPFVEGMTEIISRFHQDRTNGLARPLLMFSDEPFTGSSCMTLEGEVRPGWHRYYCEELDAAGNLCPVLLSYFPTPPQFLHVRLADFSEKPGDPVAFTLDSTGDGEPSERNFSACSGPHRDALASAH